MNMSAEGFIGELRVLYVSEEGKSISGIAATSSHLYILGCGADHIVFLDRKEFYVTWIINIPGFKDARDLAVCHRYNCSYISDSGY